MARVRIGSAEIDLKLLTGRFTQQVEDVRRKTKSMRDGMVDAATKTRSLTAALAGVATAGYAAKAIFEIGSAVEETGSKFATVFGSESGAVQKSLDQFATLAGLSRSAAQDITATTGAIVQGFGISGAAAADMSVQVSRLAADLASFNNIPVKETSQAIQSALTGEMESMKRLGIAILDTDVKSKALAMTGKRTVTELTNQEVVTARLALITERAGVQVGDLQRTQYTAAASARQLSADIANLKEEFAVGLTPALAWAVKRVREFIGGIKLIGVDTAVALAKFKLSWAKAFGDDSDLKRAIDNLHSTSVAARELRYEIIGINEAVSGSPSGASGGTGASRAFENLSARIIETATGGEFLGDVAVTVATNLNAVGVAAGFAADEQDRLNSAMGKFRAVSGALGFLGRFIGPLAALAGPVGAITSGLGVVSQLTGAFKGMSMAPAGTGDSLPAAPTPAIGQSFAAASKGTGNSLSAAPTPALGQGFADARAGWSHQKALDSLIGPLKAILAPGPAGTGNSLSTAPTPALGQGFAAASAGGGPVVVNINGLGLGELVSSVTVEQGRAATFRRVARI